ncbi:WD40-repeat-containing domain protein [Lasiosphaeria hispida]|uniref:WD40-repeat-containing domain protein n=1 Tax=Lasiosphaeria hispida TaxID=260671 RepID=A0AAJ0HJI2_9PEZI|nr:WD40-repeat-containing domain protein [Lasiosphaeria hispida]
MASTFRKWVGLSRWRKKKEKAQDGSKIDGSAASANLSKGTPLILQSTTNAPDLSAPAILPAPSSTTPTLPSTAPPTSPSDATSPALSATQSTEIQSAKQRIAEHGPTTPSGTTTEPCTPTSPSADHDQAPRPNIDARATDHHQPAATSQAPPPALSVEPRAEPKSIESTEQPTSAVSTSQRLWDAAYNSLAEDKDTAELVGSYMETLEKVLEDKTCEPSAVDASRDPSQRQAHMRKLVEEGQAKISTSSKITQGVGDAFRFVLSAKAMIDLAIQNIPQAALPWAGVCIGLQILLNPINAVESNLKGIAHVISRMDWYCSLTEHVLMQDNIVVGKGSFKSVQLLLENRVVELYKVLLLYQMKSVCSFYRHQGWVFLRGLVNIDDWDTNLKSVTDAEATLQNDLSQFNNQHTKSLLGKLIEKAEKRQAVLGDIHQALQGGIAVQKEIHQTLQDGIVAQKAIHRDEKDTQCLQDLRLTDPRHDKTRIIETKGGLLADAYRWILDNAEFRQWCDGEQNRLLWIKGNPGKGKTMLLCGIIDKLQSLTSGTDLLSFFFCQATDARINNATAILRGLIYLLLDQQPSLIRHARKNYDHAGKALFEDANGWVALSEIFRNILQDPSLESVNLVIDALDECEHDLPKLLRFVVDMSSMFPHVKWIVSSRNWPNIEDGLETAKQKVRLSLELNEGSISSAVSTYIQHKVDELAQRKKYDNETRDAVQRHLTLNANDTFLWVALVCQELEKVSRSRALTKLNTFPPGLGSLYQRMIDQIRRSDEADLCKQMLAVISITYRPITIQELASFVDIPEGISDDLEFLTEIVGLCGSFLTLREPTIYFIHQSAKDFLLKDASSEIFPSGMEAVHYSIFSQSLHVMSRALRHDMYGLAAPGFPIENVNPPELDLLAAARYACVYWVDHLHGWQSSNIKHPDVFRDGGVIDVFLRQHYLHWLEALSLCRSMSHGIFSMAKLESILQQRTITSQLPSLVYDMRRFILYCRWLVENHPLQVYASALVFSPARSMTRDLFKQEARRWITTEPVVEDDWNACRQTLEGHSDYVSSVAFSPDSKLIISGSADKTVKIWDAATGSCMQTLKGHSNGVHSAAFSPDSRLIISGSADKTVKIWDAATGLCMQTLKGHSGKVYSVAFSPDLKLVISGSYDETVKIWDIATESYTQTLKGHSGSVSSVMFSPDSKLVISGSYDQIMKIWDAATGSCTQTFEGHSGKVCSATFSPDLKLVISGSDDKTVKIWDAATGSCMQTLEGHSNYVSSVAFSPDLKLVISGSGDQTVKIWNAATGSCMQTLKGHSGSVSSVAFSPDLKLVISGSGDQTVKIWDAATESCMQTLKGHSGKVRSVTFSPDSKLVISMSSYDQTVKIWNVATGLCTQTLKGHSSNVCSATFSPDSKLVISGSWDHTVKIWDVATGSCTQTLKGHSSNVYSAMSSPDLKLIISGSHDKTVKIWDVATGSCMQTLKGHSRSVYSATFSSDSKLIISGSGDDTVKIWNVVTGSCMQTLEGHSNSVYSVTFSPDLKLAISGSFDQTVKIWDVATGSCTQTLKGHSNWVSSVAFSPDSKLVISKSGDQTVKIWDAVTGSCMQTLEGHGGSIMALKLFTSWSGNGKTPYHQNYSISLDSKWILRGSENWLWLPSGYRPACSALAASMIAIGCSSGCVLIMTFPTDN